LEGCISQLSDEQVSLSGEQDRDKLARTLWLRAQQDVERDLRKPAFRRQMWALADEVAEKIPWDGEHRESVELVVDKPDENA
jgi:hypothetical protein